MKKRWLVGLMTHQYKKLPMTMKMWKQINVMPRTWGRHVNNFSKRATVLATYMPEMLTRPEPHETETQDLTGKWYVLFNLTTRQTVKFDFICYNLRKVLKHETIGDETETLANKTETRDLNFWSWDLTSLIHAWLNMAKCD